LKFLQDAKRKTTLTAALVVLGVSIATALAAVLSFAQAQTIAHPYPFGMCSNGRILSVDQYRKEMLAAGARIARVDCSFSTCCPEKGLEPDQWKWSGFDGIRRARSDSRLLDYLPILGYEPKRASSLDFNAAARAYGKFVFESVRRYKSDLHYWESWNEPELPGHQFFRGNGRDFFPYQKACYLSAKKADPQCKVLFAGLCFANIEGYLNAHGLKPPTISPPASSFLEDYLQECQKDPDAKKNNYYFDIMNQHSYSRAADLYDYTQVDRALMRQYTGTEKPIWFTETGFCDTGGTWGGTADEYCDYLLQSFAWARLAGVERVFHFQLDNSNGHGLFKGMLGEPKPALTTYRDVLVAELADVESVEQLHGNPGTGFLEGYSPYQPRAASGYNLFEFKRSRSPARVFMCFSDTSDAVDIRIPAKAPSATLIDRHNSRSILLARDGFYLLHLPGATNLAGWPVSDDPRAKALGKPEHLVGGATYLVIEK
jgi:hypothetical protein